MRLNKLWKPMIIGSFLFASVPISNTSALAEEQTSVATNPKLSLSDLTIFNGVGPDSISFNNLTIGNTYTIYFKQSEEADDVKLTSFTADETSKYLTFEELGKDGGFIKIIERKDGKLLRILTKILNEESKPIQIPPFSKGNVAIINQIKQDTLTFQGLIIGHTYTIYQDEGATTKLASFTANATSNTIHYPQLGENGGAIYIVVQKDANFLASTPTKVTFGSEKYRPLASKNITITNHVTRDTMILNGLTKGVTYSIYQDETLKNKLMSFAAMNSSETVFFSQVGENGGTLYVVASHPDYQDSDATKVTFKSEKLTPLAAKHIKISNTIKNDTITLENLIKGNTYTIYQDATLKKTLRTFTATHSSKTLTFKQLGGKGGEIYIVVSHPNYQASNVTTSTFKAQPTTGLTQNNVKIKNRLKKSDVMTFTGLKKGYKYVVYKDAKKKSKLTSFTATTSSKKLTFKQLGTTSGKLYITAKAKDYLLSDTTTVSYAKEPFIKMKLIKQIKPVPTNAILKKNYAGKYGYNSWDPPKYHQDIVKYSYHKTLPGGGKITGITVSKVGDRSVTGAKVDTIEVMIDGQDKKGQSFLAHKTNHFSSSRIIFTTFGISPQFTDEGFFELNNIATKFLKSFK